MIIHVCAVIILNPQFVVMMLCCLENSYRVISHINAKSIKFTLKLPMLHIASSIAAITAPSPVLADLLIVEI